LPRGQHEHGVVVENGKATHVLVPIDEYERMQLADMAREAIAALESDQEAWIDADEFGLQLAGERIASARKAQGLTQKELGERLGVPQSQISRIERKPDHSTLRMLKRVAKALGVDVRALV
jgi:UDP-N-acetylglucosamine 1-carboxyvinyltransferase